MESSPQASQQRRMGPVSKGRSAGIRPDREIQPHERVQEHRSLEVDGDQTALVPTDLGLRHAGQAPHVGLTQPAVEASRPEVAPHQVDDIPASPASAIRRTTSPAHGRRLARRT
jgi:hypothetical protein